MEERMAVPSKHPMNAVAYCVVEAAGPGSSLYAPCRKLRGIERQELNAIQLVSRCNGRDVVGILEQLTAP
jgi:hypothetical protein